MKRVIKNKILPALLVMLFFAAALAVIAYSAGMFGTDGEDRRHIGDGGTTGSKTEPVTTSPQPGTTGDPATGETSAPVTDSKPSTGPDTDEREYSDSLRFVFSANSVDGLLEDRASVTLEDRVAYYNRLAGAVTLYDGEKDKIQSTSLYDPERSGILLAGKGLASDFVCGTQIVTEYEREYSKKDASYVTHSVDVICSRNKIVPYMGYLIIADFNDDGEIVYSIADESGRVIIDDAGDKTPLYARDYSNRPVFIDGSEVYWSFDGEKFVKITYASIRSELWYDYPATGIASYNGVAEVKFVDKYFNSRFVNVSTNKNYITTKYLRAFNFTDNGLAVVALVDSRIVRIINTSNKSTIGDSVWRYFPGTTNWVTYRFMLPDTLGIESIGCTAFDNGWLRVRRQAVSQMNNTKGYIVQDEYFLIDSEGNEFAIPEGYELVGYSNGVLLLSNGYGYYGYYSIDGYWIAQPIYTYARPFIQGLAVVGYSDGTVGMIDVEGNIVMPFIYTSLSDVSSGVIAAYIEGVGWNTYVMTEKENEPLTGGSGD